MFSPHWYIPDVCSTYGGIVHKVAATQGSEINRIFNDLEWCFVECTQTPNCHSFSYGPDNSGDNLCILRDKKLTDSDTFVYHATQTTYYQNCGDFQGAVVFKNTLSYCTVIFYFF